MEMIRENKNIAAYGGEDENIIARTFNIILHITPHLLIHTAFCQQAAPCREVPFMQFRRAVPAILYHPCCSFVPKLCHSIVP
jgi:hypothetical protein